MTDSRNVIAPREPKPPIDRPFWLGEDLVAQGKLTAEAFASAQDFYRKHSRDGFARTLVSLNLVTADVATALVAEKYGVFTVNPLAFRTDSKAVIDAAKRLHPSRAKSHNVLAVAYHPEQNIVDLYVADPGAYPVSTARTDIPGCHFRYFVAPLQSLQGWISEIYHGTRAGGNVRAAGDSPLEYLTKLLRSAILAGATDVHLEKKKNLLVRHRIDNVMVHCTFVDGEMREGLIQEAKRFGQMDIHEKRVPMHGEQHMEVDGRSYNFRVSSVPARTGESIVIRIIDEQAGARPLETLGLYPDELRRLERLLDEPNGVIYVTGPTGSGKTTFLYSALNRLPSADLKIITLEQPVECLFAQWTQIPIEPGKGGVDFAEMLPEVLRQDPDVILIGETRDLETARITIQASLTGHLCFTTLHTNEASGVPQRLVDMGIEPYMIASSARGFIAQRLLRKLCTRCSIPDPNAEEEIKKLEPLFHRCGINKPEFRALPLEARFSCPECHGRGYAGRVAVMEVFPIDEGCQRLITQRKDNKDLENYFRDQGYLSLFEDALRKAASGHTSLAEVYSNITMVMPMEKLLFRL